MAEHFDGEIITLGRVTYRLSKAQRTVMSEEAFREEFGNIDPRNKHMADDHGDFLICDLGHDPKYGRVTVEYRGMTVMRVEPAAITRLPDASERRSFIRTMRKDEL